MSHPGVYETPTEREERELAHHPGPRQYVTIGVILALITGIEVGIYYISSVRDILVPSLIALAIIKFALVVLYFMHLKFDSLLFRRLFITGLILALTVFGVVLAAFFLHGGGAAPLVTGGG
jgi:cytochrome c oxidase subunit 4